MSDAENVAVMQRWFDAVNAHDADRLADLLDERLVWEAGSSSGLGVQATTAAWRALFNASARIDTSTACSDGRRS
ncbi:MAG: hypothetical protein AUJ01_02285 [Acidobacteria bacterium 13_1_40CM_3_65_5]|nr:MAG: hypothetical protein AUJ01_02285 [Acidobacteria bacterium 13_1_40CM_3_65_5]